MRKTIKYIDSNIIHEQTDTIAKPVVIEVCGFIIQETDEYITFALEKIGNEYRNQISVPKVAILKI